MPKGVPKTEGEKMNDKFEAGYQKMRRDFKKGRASRKADKQKCAYCEKAKGDCGCGK